MEYNTTGATEQSAQQRVVSNNQIGDHAIIDQGDKHFHLHPPPTRTAVRIIPYPRNEDVICRSRLVEKLDGLLPSTLGCSAALWGLGGSGSLSITRTDDVKTPPVPSFGFTPIAKRPSYMTTKLLQPTST
ncbi:hypothetical protein G7Z17_g9 [Cylindrodendrum hubeiense]|uniref:Uncharacterized protein n=1 Tax=Cylindrodendrum hubeiense TaxID=595255 RepID=A0A9P5HSS0_9HYPO|nr:hypothetical protein G7Z17_g9 [Cylindrodendrum hubeiense]